MVSACVVPPPGSGGWQPSPVLPPTQQVSFSEMRRFCEREAASRYRVSQRDVEVGRVRETSRGFIVDGRVRQSRGGTATIECRFGPRGGFDGMRETGTSGGSSGNLDVSRREMMRFCEDEAARRYRVSTSAIELGRLVETGNGFLVDGRVRRDGRNVATFECRFGPRGGFSSMRQTS